MSETKKAQLDMSKVKPERMSILRGLPMEVKQQITGEEAKAFLYGDELPEDLMEKLRDYMVDEEK